MEAILEATARDSFGKNEERRTRRDGKVPAVVYGAMTWVVAHVMDLGRQADVERQEFI